MKLLTTLALLLAFAPAYAADAAPENPAAKATDGFLLVTDEQSDTNQIFRAELSDKSFQKALARWAKKAGWSLSWELGTEYSIGYAADFGTDFISAVDRLCTSLKAAGVRAHSRVYLDNKVIRIVNEGEQ